MRPEDYDDDFPADRQDKIVWDPIDLGCSQFICQCKGFEPLAKDSDNELHVN